MLLFYSKYFFKTLQTLHLVTQEKHLYLLGAFYTALKFRDCFQLISYLVLLKF